MTPDCPYPAQVTHERSDERQKRALVWAKSVYGERVTDRRYQAFRFLEEACELAQAQGLNFQDMLKVLAYVDERPAGETSVEIGDVLLSVDIMSENLGLSVDGCHTDTLTRIQALDADKCRAKDEAKCAAGLI